MRLTVIVVFFLFVCHSLAAQKAKQLSFEQAFLQKGEPLLASLPKIVGWFDDNRYVEVSGGKVWLKDATGGKSRLLLDPAAFPEMQKKGVNPLRPADHTRDWGRLVFLFAGDVFLFTRATGSWQPVTATPASEENPTFSPDGNWLAFTSGGDLFAFDIKSGRTNRLTADGSPDILNGYASWIYHEEVFGRENAFRAFNWSPDSRKIAFLRFDQSRVPVFPLLDLQSSFGRLEYQHYPQAGSVNPEVRLGIIDPSGGALEWIAEEKEHYLAFPFWQGSGKRLFFQRLNRGQDRLTISCYDTENRRLTDVYREGQDGWVEFIEPPNLQPLKEGGVLLLSDKDGWRHLYRILADGGETQLTRGEWSIRSLAGVAEDRDLIFFNAAKDDSTVSDLFRIPLAGGALRRLTSGQGTHEPTVSPRGDYFLDRFSSLSRPPRLDLFNDAGEKVREIGDSRLPGFAGYDLATVEQFRIRTVDGTALPACWFLPPAFDPRLKYPVLLSIYGGPGACSVIDKFPATMENYFLAQQGIIVVMVDHRGSGHFGKKGMSLMHRQLGRWEMNDYGEAARYLSSLPFVDSKRLGITGKSYGGYVTSLALAIRADLFAFGQAEFSVTDWRLFDSVYSERYLDAPEENPEGYRQASVLTHAGGYRGGLRLVHGSLDDNVHLQHTLQLLNALLDLGKPVEVMIYPGERHGVRGSKRAGYKRSFVDYWRRCFFDKIPAEERATGGRH